MTPTPRNDSALLEKWMDRYHEAVEKDGKSLRQVCFELAAQYNCDPNTVRAYLDPSFREFQRASSRESERRRYARHKRRKLRIREYSRFSRNPESYLPPILQDLEDGDILSLDEITRRVRNFFNVGKFRPKTIEKIVRTYCEDIRMGRIRGPPLEETSPGIWRFSPGQPNY